MAGRLNRKVLCFVDEYGTAGAGDLYLGACFMLARETGRIDKCFSDQLSATANEIHSARMKDGYLQTCLLGFWRAAPKDRFVMINRKLGVTDAPGPILYARALVETVKVGLKRFRRDVLGRDTISNVEVITDLNHHNGHVDFDREVSQARAGEGVFRSVNHLVRIDSAASRMLQLADAVAYSRKWVLRENLNAANLHERYGIQIV